MFCNNHHYPLLDGLIESKSSTYVYLLYATRTRRGKDGWRGGGVLTIRITQICGYLFLFFSYVQQPFKVSAVMIPSGIWYSRFEKCQNSLYSFVYSHAHIHNTKKVKLINQKKKVVNLASVKVPPAIINSTSSINHLGSKVFVSPIPSFCVTCLVHIHINLISFPFSLFRHPSPPQ